MKGGVASMSETEGPTLAEQDEERRAQGLPPVGYEEPENWVLEPEIELEPPTNWVPPGDDAA